MEYIIDTKVYLKGYNRYSWLRFYSSKKITEKELNDIVIKFYRRDIDKYILLSDDSSDKDEPYYINTYDLSRDICKEISYLTKDSQIEREKIEVEPIILD